MLTTSRDNTLAVWDAKRGLDMLASVGHNNNTGRWVVPFRASWGPAGDAIMCGSMGRQVSACWKSHRCCVRWARTTRWVLLFESLWGHGTEVSLCGSRKGQVCFLEDRERDRQPLLALKGGDKMHAAQVLSYWCRSGSAVVVGAHS